MEIPYVVTARKDTGLYNAKIAIWLFLASEVMLFGGFFSAYVYLRMGADFPWPERTLPVAPGLINTFVLIASSVTVVLAWASLKLRNWGRFQIYMGFTIVAAVIFMGLKGVEYYVKLHHQAVRLKDYTVIEGHLDKIKDTELEADRINFETSQLTFSTVRAYAPWVDDFNAQAKAANAKITLASDLKVDTTDDDKHDPQLIAAAGTELSNDLLAKVKALHLVARKHNAKLRTKNLKEQWELAWDKAEAQGGKKKKGWELASGVNVDTTALAPHLFDETPNLAFKVEPPVKFSVKPRDIKEGAEQGRMRDDTVLTGKLLESPMKFHYVDAIDFRHLAMKAEEKGIDPEVAIENSWLIKNNAEAREAWEWHKGRVKALETHLLENYGKDDHGMPERVPTKTERYRIGWKDFVAKSDGKTGIVKGDTKIMEEFTGPDYEGRAAAHTFPHMDLPRDQVQFAAKFTPAWNTYYAIYFTMTALHGLHVIGGAIVLGYYLFCGKKMYLSNPEWLANRVEVGGLFWHFVDLVWIFLFPLLYLM